jgi:phage gpG-like protein
MGIDASALIAALQERIGEAPDVSTDAVQRMSTTAQQAIRAKLGSGEPLHIRTGRLFGSVDQTYFSPGAVAMAHVAPTTVYARIQELGGVSGKGHRSHLPPRPYVAPAVEASMGLFEDDAVEAIRPLFW